MELRPPNPPLSDGVVSLRPWTLDDVPAVAAACDDDEIARWIHALPSPYRESDAREYVVSTASAWKDGLGVFFAVVDRASGDVVGSIARMSSTLSSRTSRSATGQRRRPAGAD
jgi:RimJ/RimL family protein N-acetyltransferase